MPRAGLPGTLCRFLGFILAVMPVVLAPPAVGRAAELGRKGSVSLYGARWIESRFPQFPQNLVTGNLGYRDTYLAGIVGSVVVLDGMSVPLPFTDTRLDGFGVEVEGQLIKHYGLQHHLEAASAAVIRTPDLSLFGGLAMNGAWGAGFSYAFRDPEYELGRGGLRGVDTVRLQFHMELEAEFGFGSSPVHLFTRLHHRSGAYGVVSPQKTGSNYLGAGIRLDIR